MTVTMIKTALENNFVDFKTEVKNVLTKKYAEQIQQLKDSVVKNLLTSQEKKKEE